VPHNRWNAMRGLLGIFGLLFGAFALLCAAAAAPAAAAGTDYPWKNAPSPAAFKNRTTTCDNPNDSRDTGGWYWDENGNGKFDGSGCYSVTGGACRSLSRSLRACRSSSRR